MKILTILIIAGIALCSTFAGVAAAKPLGDVKAPVSITILPGYFQPILDILPIFPVRYDTPVPVFDQVKSPGLINSRMTFDDWPLTPYREDLPELKTK
ncbi:hypothetical protein KKA00_07190 [bacterium]|nr:hypothetical protein [bacterium]MBU1651989.1 hypothetical protein [bacterium]